MATELQFSDRPLRCSECGGGCGDGYIIKGGGQRERDTDYCDDEVVCAACLEDEGRFDAADMAMDMQEGC